MPEPPGHPRFAPVYEPSFEADRRRLGLSGRNFDRFFTDVEDDVCDYPWEYSTEIPNSDGMRMYSTERAAPDIPPLYTFYRVETDPNKIIFWGLERAWSRADLPPW